MDHLIIPPEAKHLRVPYKCTEPYDGGDFFGYPARKGWTDEDLLGLNGFGGRDESEVEAFFQTWLYFGTLTCVFKLQGVDIDIAEFLATDEHSGEAFVTTCQVLPAKIRSWKIEWNKVLPVKIPSSRKIEWQDPWRGNQVKETVRILEELCKYVDRYCGSAGLARAPSGTTLTTWPVAGETSLSLIALGYILGEAARGIYGDGHIQMHWGASPLVKRRLLEHGWCPLDVRRLLTDIAVDGHYYLLLKDCPDGKKKHRGCDESVCRATTIDEATYVVQHVQSGCKCGDGGVSDDLIAQVIQKKGIPVVSWQQDAGGGRSGFIVEDASATNVTYVAISHVWADGLGNPITNSLPTCQLERIQASVNATLSDESQPVRFWMDTLCIPVADKYHDVRKMAIRQMRQIYRHAGGVLVLDAGLQNLSRSSTNEEKAIGLYMSSWLHRLWTFQEGMFAKKLFFQLEDGPLQESYLADDSVKRKEEDEKNGLYGSFAFTARSAALGHFIILRDFTEMKLAGNGVLFPPLAHAIQQRTTTRKSDEAICAATILNTDLEEILKVPSKNLPEDTVAAARMEVFLRQVGEFPPGIIFHHQPRMRKDGYCWAPKMIMGAQPGDLRRDLNNPLSSFNGQGLCVQYPGFILDTLPASPATEIIVVMKNTGHRYRLELFPEEPDAGRGLPNWESTVSYAVVMLRSLAVRPEMHGTSAIIGKLRDPAATRKKQVTPILNLLLVEGTVELTCECRAWVGVDFARLGVSWPSVAAELLLDTQRWCVY
ncbi:hypothetical protein B0H11DRAFT_1703297 [Mycena galericulata]|nr:hypothetical protein B0H11DRAFT_1703297 [Mycena galericulata]